MKQRLVVAALLAVAAAACATKHVPWSNDEALLRRAASLQCTWQRGASAHWNSGSLQIAIGEWNPEQPATVSFSNIDRKAGTATFTGARGTFPVTLLPTTGGLTFVEQPPRGGANITTVFPGHPEQDFEFLVAHSRHYAHAAGRPLPSQYYGTCTALPH